MPPGGGGGGGGGEHGSTVQSHPPATVRRDEESTPPLPAIVPVASEDVKKKKKRKRKKQVPSLPEGSLVEILSRVPYRSLCRFKCVSKPWLKLCSAPDIRNKSPQTLSGFFYREGFSGFSFCNLNGRGPPLVDPLLPFLRKMYPLIMLQHVSGGLLLCCCVSNNPDDQPYHVVCNPATKEWTVLPPVEYPIASLSFDAAVPSRFVVFAPQSHESQMILGETVTDPLEVAIYSSETGRWTHVQSGWSTMPLLNDDVDTHVFLNGTIHLPTMDNTIATVDFEGKVWREIQMPNDLPNICNVGQSQGRLYAWQIDNSHDCQCQLYIWVLEDYDTAKWTLKHTVNVLELFGRNRREDKYSYVMFAAHLDCNVIFLTDMNSMTLSYDMDNLKVTVICTKGIIGLPYIPCFAGLPSAGH